MTPEEKENALRAIWALVLMGLRWTASITTRGIHRKIVVGLHHLNSS